MDSEHNENRAETYYIPQNFEDAGGFFGGRITKRNGIDLFAICGPIAFIDMKFVLPNLPLKIGIIITAVTLMPLGMLCIFGIGGESLTQMLMTYIRFRCHRRKCSYISFSDAEATATKQKLTFDIILDTMASDGVKTTLALFKPKEKQNEESKAPAAEAEVVAQDDTNPGRARPRKQRTSVVENNKQKQPKPASKVLSSARAEMILRKLELCNDEDDYEEEY